MECPITLLQKDLTRLSKEFPPDSWQARTAHNARVKLQCFQPVILMHDAIGEYIEVAHEVNEDQEMLHELEESEERQTLQELETEGM